MRVILGLGNPGREFTGTRHNVGHRCIDLIARRQGLQFQRRLRVAVAQGTIGETPVVLAKSRTFMNVSGLAARYLVDRFRVRPPALTVIYDDMDLPVGKFRIRPRGSSGGHKGMESIIARLGTQEFPRIRIGIGRPSETGDGVDHVLGRFTASEEEIIREVVQRTAEAVEIMLSSGVEAAMNRFN